MRTRGGKRGRDGGAAIVSFMENARPVGSYLVLTASFNVAAWAIGAWLGKRRRASIGDVLLLGVATQEISRITAKDRVTKPVRAPFVDETAGGKERPKRDGARRALGELLTCQYCMAPWIALGMTSLFLVAPNATRTFATVMSVAAVSDFLNRGYAIAQEKKKEIAERTELSAW